MRKTGSIIVVILMVLAMDAGLAGYCRSNCDFWSDAYSDTDHRIRSQAFHHGLAANREINEAWGMARYRYATNSLGFKDKAPRSVDLAGQGRRVLFMGDSFTEGKGFPYEQTFVGLIDADLGEKGVEVLNGGVDSSAPVIYRLKAKYLLEELGLRFNTLVVFLDISDIFDQALRYEYDGEGRLIIPPKEPPPALTRAFHYLRGHSVIVRFSSVAFDHLYLLARVAKHRIAIAAAWGKTPWDVTALDMWAFLVTDIKESAWSYDEQRWTSYGARGRQRSADEMESLLALLKRHGVDLVLAVYPWPDQMFHDPQSPRHRGFWRDWAEARQVPFIDLFPLFTEGEPGDVLSRYFIPYDFHWNAEGHDLVARVFLDEFRLPGP